MVFSSTKMLSKTMCWSLKIRFRSVPIAFSDFRLVRSTNNLKQKDRVF